MSYEISQLTQLNCNMCGHSGVVPRTETYYDRFAKETITEATWTCPRCGSRFNSGIMSRVKDNEKSEKGS